MQVWQLVIALIGQSAAQPATAEEVIAAGRERIQSVVGSRPCSREQEPDEIVVCGSREEQERYRVLPTPDTSPRTRAGGEQLSAMAVDSSRCTTVGFNQQCGSIDLIGLAARVIVTIGKALIDQDE